MARIIEQKMNQAINYECDWRKDNTSVEVIHHGIHGTPSYQKELQVKLHGHTIARIFPGDRMILSSCGWRTKTTKSRINSILTGLNFSVRLYQESYVWYIGEREFTDNMEINY
jgi:hypothetical protein